MNGQEVGNAVCNKTDQGIAAAGLIEVIVSSEITKSGPTISGDIHGIVLVQPESGYAPDSGHAGTGTVVGVVC